MTGVLAGLCDAGVDPARADVVIGTSAGAIFGSRLLAGEPARELYERQLARADRVGLTVTSAQTLRFLWAALGSRDPERSVLRLGRAALRARTGPESDVYDALRPMLRSVGDWPDRGEWWSTAAYLPRSGTTDHGTVIIFTEPRQVSLDRGVDASVGHH